MNRAVFPSQPRSRGLPSARYPFALWTYCRTLNLGRRTCNKPSPRATNISRRQRTLVTSDRLRELGETWIAEYRGAVWKIARAYTLTAEDCQDLTQEILLQIWRSLPQFQGTASASTWVYRVALNTALGYRRKERHRRSRQQPLFDMNEVAGQTPESSTAAGDRETVERLYAAIRQLPKYDAALVLLYLDGLTYRQMSDVIGITESNVGVKLIRAKKALTRLLNEPANEFGAGLPPPPHPRPQVSPAASPQSPAPNQP
jgi:RNA polymerase sigma-70 factor, ECF subfamily